MDRPKAPAAADVSAADDAIASGYEAAVRQAVREVLAGAFAHKAGTIAAGLEQAGGVEAAVRVLLAAAKVP